jgi:predicted nuclease with RNAse H fold
MLDLGRIQTGLSGSKDVSFDRAATTRPKSSKLLQPLLENPAGTMFLDIETTGLSKHYDYITLIGYKLSGDYHVWMPGQDERHFRSALSRATSIVTFNGSGFDLPFLDTFFEGLSWPKHHVDLRYACRRLGLTGGQKAIEHHLRINCRSGIEEVDGAMAVILWHRYLRGEKSALRQLIEYNRADVRAMAHILDHVVGSASTDLVSRMLDLHRFCAAPDIRHGLAHPDGELPEPSAHLRNVSTFSDLFADTAAEHATIVGLDLTGSEARPSGFCILNGSEAMTQTLRTDAEIIANVVNARPDLVSIDSPLCLPIGRTRVTDDDPARHTAGIMRVSERILKRRGINVYPCLLPSMQRLTERGIRLAGDFRSRGIDVIECYPGAAQDIMGIPRKGAGEEWLKLGLSEFGITGDFTTERLTHDELDAITCSLVGSFHIAGLTEGLGGDGEEPMFVPKLPS